MLTGSFISYINTYDTYEEASFFCFLLLYGSSVRRIKTIFKHYEYSPGPLVAGFRAVLLNDAYK